MSNKYKYSKYVYKNFRNGGYDGYNFDFNSTVDQFEMRFRKIASIIKKNIMFFYNLMQKRGLVTGVLDLTTEIVMEDNDMWNIMHPPTVVYWIIHQPNMPLYQQNGNIIADRLNQFPCLPVFDEMKMTLNYSLKYGMSRNVVIIHNNEIFHYFINPKVLDYINGPDPTEVTEGYKAALLQMIMLPKQYNEVIRYLINELKSNHIMAYYTRI